MEQYSHKERIQMILAGETPDRFAASMWRHFFHMEHHAEGTADAMLQFQKEFDWDFMKINPRADYHTEGWGLKQEWSHDEFKKHRKVSFPIQSIDDWANIKPLDMQSPPLAEHLKVVSLIRKGSDRELPLLMTVFNPLGIAGRMVPDRKILVDHLRTAPEKVEPALRAITDTFVHFSAELRNAGADGLFYATLQWASEDLLTWEEYRRFGVPYDLEVIRAAETDALNILHVCAGSNYLAQLAEIEDYRAGAYNWDSQDPTNLPIDKAYDVLGSAPIVGGVDHEGWLLRGTPEEVGLMIDELKDRHERRRLIIGPGCAIPPEVSTANLKAIRERL